MSFYKKYELQRLAHEGEAKVFRATQSATARQVFLHVFPVNEATRDLAAEVGRRLASGPAPDLLETGEFAGAIYVVTAPDESMFNLRAYLHAHTPGGSPTQTAVPLPPPTPPGSVAPSARLFTTKPPAASRSKSRPCPNGKGRSPSWR
ncbi:MAG: hypothetical protein J0L64_14495, partial [Acidobacteria bacterium]|nr:hypothetical protein [Acidobacteriota bacterium]